MGRDELSILSFLCVFVFFFSFSVLYFDTLSFALADTNDWCGVVFVSVFFPFFFLAMLFDSQIMAINNIKRSKFVTNVVTNYSEC